jgi:DNA-binding NtrC family response regulator
LLLLSREITVSRTVSYVLVVDDEEPIRAFLERRLQTWGYRVQHAQDAAEALEVMAFEPASIAIVDVRMPGHDGLWLASQIRQLFPETAIIMATGADDVDEVDAKALGVFAHVLKPFDQVLLRQVMDRASTAIMQARSSDAAI